MKYSCQEYEGLYGYTIIEYTACIGFAVTGCSGFRTDMAGEGGCRYECICEEAVIVAASSNEADHYTRDTLFPHNRK